MEESKEILNIIDGDFLLYTATVGNKVLDEEGNPIKEDNKFVYTDKTFEEVIESADYLINSILTLSNANKYIGFLGDSKCFRYDICDKYKANRVNRVPPLWIKELKSYLAYHWGFILLKNRLEADDAVNISRNIYKSKYNIFITTTDKDLIKCIPGKYIQARDMEIIRTSEDKATEAFWTSMITGDAADNIRGIPKAGKKFAEKLFTDVKSINEYKNLVKEAYINKFGDEIGQLEFDKNYNLLYILDKFDDFNIDLLDKNLINYVKI